MVEFRCIGHDSRHVCRSVLVASGGFILLGIYSNREFYPVEQIIFELIHIGIAPFYGIDLLCIKMNITEVTFATGENNFFSKTFS